MRIPILAGLRVLALSGLAIESALSFDWRAKGSPAAIAISDRRWRRRSRCALQRAAILTDVAAVAQLVECVLGKDEVTGSNPVSSFSIGIVVSNGADDTFLSWIVDMQGQGSVATDKNNNVVWMSMHF